VDTAVDRAASNAVHVRFRIREHDPMVVDSVEIRGVPDSAMRTRIRRGVKLRPGDPLDRFSLEASSVAIVAGLRRAGYLAATARAGERADSARRRAVAWIDVTMGTRVRLGEVRVDARGLDSTAPRIPARRVERITRLRPGALLGTQELADARQSLEAVGLFDEIRVTLDSIRSLPPVDGTANAAVAVVDGGVHGRPRVTLAPVEQHEAGDIAQERALRETAPCPEKPREATRARRRRRLDGRLERLGGHGLVARERHRRDLGRRALTARGLRQRTRWGKEHQHTCQRERRAARKPPRARGAFGFAHASRRPN
jgi:hypothetical protein